MRLSAAGDLSKTRTHRRWNQEVEDALVKGSQFRGILHWIEVIWEEPGPCLADFSDQFFAGAL
jgi:hypothetical protein